MPEPANRLVDAVLGAAGWDAESIPVEGLPQGAPARRYTNVRTTLCVTPLDGRRLALFVDGRRPLLVKTIDAEAESRQRMEAVLRLVLEWQDRLGEPESDGAFFRALLALGVRGLVLQDGRLHSDLDWPRLDAGGRPQGDYLLSCGCQELTGRPGDVDPAMLRVAGEFVHEGWSEIFCECRRCGRRWKVEEDTGYHVTLWSWADVSHSSEHSRHYDRQDERSRLR